MRILWTCVLLAAAVDGAAVLRPISPATSQGWSSSDTEQRMKSARETANSPLWRGPNMAGPVRDSSPIGELELDSLIAESTSSKIFSAHVVPTDVEPIAKRRRFDFAPVVADDDATKVAVKYFNDCKERIRFGDSGLENLAVHEYIVLAMLNETKIAPNVFHISPPTFLVPNEEPEDRLMAENIWKDGLEKCQALGTEFRFIVEDLVGISVADVFDSLRRKPELEQPEVFAAAISVALDALGKLEHLHSLGFVHGDVHEFNIVLADAEADAFFDVFILKDTETRLIDFQFAVYTPPLVGPYVGRSALFLSPWQCEEQRLGFRDDVYRLLETLARLMFGSGWSLQFAGLLKEVTGEVPRAEWERLKAAERKAAGPIKRRTPMFGPGKMGPGVGHSLPHGREIERTLDEVMLSVLALADPDSPVDYAAIRRAFNHVTQLLAAE